MGSPTSLKAINTDRAILSDERAQQILRLSRAKVPQEAIAKSLGISVSTVASLKSRYREALRAENLEIAADMRDEELEGLDAVEARANAIAQDKEKPVRDRLAADALILDVKRERAKRLGLYAPERHQHLVGQADGGLSIPFEQLEAMSPEELDRLIAAERERLAAAAVIDTTGEEIADEDPEPDDELPPEVRIEDPGPRALIARDALRGAEDPEAADEGDRDDGGEPR